MAIGDYISEIQTSDGNTHLIGSSVWVSTEEWNGKTITEVETEIKTKFSNLTEITWSSLKSLVDTGSLIPGMQYRITDYTCTTTQSGTKSAGHVFDIIVTADDKSTLNEVARAAKHDGDTYFADCDLNAWKLWYCLDNDTTRFAWADATDGKGVIYRMIDEFNNDVPYDFKNIQFKHPNNPTSYLYYYYTFASNNTEDNTDYSLSIANNCYSNVIKEYVSSNKRNLNFIIFIGLGCYSNSFRSDCYNNTFDSNCYHNTFGPGCYNNEFGYGCYYNTFDSRCVSNTFGEECSSNKFGPECSSNKFGPGCYNNTFGSDCYNNKFSSECYSNTFDSNCNYNTFSSECNYNTFNSGCVYNKFGSRCGYNSFGNNCAYINFASNKEATTKYTYYQNNHFGDGCRYILFKGAETASNNAQVQNYNFAQGIQGTSSVYLTIDGVRNRTFETKVAKNSNGELKIYCEADLIL